MMEVGQMEGAINLLEGCLEQDPDRVDVLEPLAFAYSANGDPVMAAITFKRIAELVPAQSEYLLYSAESLIEAGDTKGAVDRYEEYLENRPGDRAVWVILARLQADNGRLSEAIEAYLSAEQVEPRAVQEVAIGQLYLRSQNLAQAQNWFAQALQGDMEVRDEALMGLLETAVRAKRFQEAEALLEQIDAEYPGLVNQSPINNVRDQLAAWQQRREAAKAALAELEAQSSGGIVVDEPAPAAGQPAPEPAVEEPVAMEPPSGSASTATEPVASEPEPAMPAAPQSPRPMAMSRGDEEPDSPLETARQLRQQGQLQEAIREYKRILIQNDNQPLAWAELSEAYLEAGNDRWAQATASEAMRRDSDNPQYTLQFLRAAQRTMDSGRLIQEMEDAYRRFPNQPEVALALARTYAQAQNYRNARLLYQRVLEMIPQDAPVRGQVEMELQQLGR